MVIYAMLDDIFALDIYVILDTYLAWSSCRSFRGSSWNYIRNGNGLLIDVDDKIHNSIGIARDKENLVIWMPNLVVLDFAGMLVFQLDQRKPDL